MGGDVIVHFLGQVQLSMYNMYMVSFLSYLAPDILLRQISKGMHCPFFSPQSKAQILDMRLVQLVTQVQMITFLCHQCQKYANTFSFRIFHQKIWAAQQSYPTSHCRTKRFTLGHSLCIGNMCHHLLHGTSTVTVSLFCVLIEQVKACLFNI